MSVPKSVVRFDKNGVKYVSSVDRCQYTIRELTRAALRDVGKFIVRETNKKAMTLKGMKKSGRVRGKISPYQYWVRKQECDLQVGVEKAGHKDEWYGASAELGTSNMPKKAFLRTTVEESINTIVEIESKYLSALEDEAKALSMIESEDDYTEVDDA